MWVTHQRPPVRNYKQEQHYDTFLPEGLYDRKEEQCGACGTQPQYVAFLPEGRHDTTSKSSSGLVLARVRDTCS